MKFPEHNNQSYISSFMFLRFFVAGLAVPEAFGILSEPPEQKLRRKLIIISKVITNLSTNVKFGDKEVSLFIFSLSYLF